MDKNRAIYRLLKFFLPLKRVAASNFILNTALSLIASAANKQYIRVKLLHGDYIFVSKSERVVLDHFDPKAIVRYGYHLNFFTQHYVPRPNDTVFDIGCGNGTELLALSKLVGPGGIVVGIEADPNCFARSQKLIETSSVTNVVLINCAISSKSGILFLKTLSATGTGNYCTDLFELGLIPVPSLTLDQIILDLSIKTIDFMKVNIEGFEFSALNGLRPSLGRVRNLTLSCHDFLGEEFATYDRCKELLVENNFEIVTPMHKESGEWARFYLFARTNVHTP
jgi:FkbM family methyltransferase